jgi:pimeloyl-[acyl-carrier protein] methyl ester esterase
MLKSMHMSEIILLHGWSMNGDVFIRQRHAFAGYQIATPDLRGTHTGQITSLLKRRDNDKPLLTGWSMGVSMILSELDSIQPLVSGLIFISGTPCFVAREDFPHGMRPAIAQRLYRDLQKDFIKAWKNFTGLLTHAEAIDEGTSAKLQHLFAGVEEGIEPKQALDDLNWLYQGDYRSALKYIKVPLMIISGSQDRICFPDASRYIAGQVPGSSLHIIDGAGHMPFFTRAEEVNSLIRGFADGH